VICNILTDNAFLGIIAVGMTFVILSGGIDLSVGSVIAFTGVFLAKRLVSGDIAAGGVSAGAGDGLRLARLWACLSTR
jgi:ribose/xylose/arabinose/galactoside ABC-type transport system permease subunit